jgi:large subunit ribosomal protein L31
VKADIHPNYRFILVRDISCGFEFLTRSAAHESNFKEKAMFEGQEYPLMVVDISSQSHPFYTGTQKILDAEGRVQKYYRRYGLTNPIAPETSGAE